MKTPTKKDIQRVRNVNKTLQELNYNWEEIEAFWKKCIDEAKLKKELKMKTNSIILTGSMGTGKTYMANVMSTLLSPEKVLKIHPTLETIKSISDKIKTNSPELIIFDECKNFEHINHLNNLALSLNIDDLKNLIYLTSEKLERNCEGFKIVKCSFNSLY